MPTSVDLGLDSVDLGSIVRIPRTFQITIHPNVPPVKVKANLIIENATCPYLDP